MYRFRSTKYLLDEEFNELENQEIYFAPPEQLNDPMEGLKDIFWQGDEILWKNFLKHYLLCLEHIVSIWTVIGEDIEINKNFIPMLKTDIDLLTENHKQRFNEIKEKFFSNKCISSLPQLLANRSSPIRINELATYLEFIHKFAFNSINLIYSKYGMMDRIKFYEDKVDNNENLTMILEGANRFDENDKLKYHSNKMFELIQNTNNEVRILSRYKNKEKSYSNNELFIVIDFPRAYLSKLDELVYPKWYTACFMNNYHNSSVWGNYGDNHKGVCLEFRTKNNKDNKLITLNQVMGCEVSSNLRKHEYEFKRVKYEKKFIEIDFFKSLGRHPYKSLKEQWYMEEGGNISKCLKSIKFDDDWRNLYWDNFYKSVTTKTIDWEYECEYRIIIDDYFNKHDEKEKRKLKYNFCDLEGIIFGIKTSDFDKLKILEIIGKKCREIGRNNFNFYQAAYSHETGKIERIKLNLLKF